MNSSYFTLSRRNFLRQTGSGLLTTASYGVFLTKNAFAGSNSILDDEELYVSRTFTAKNEFTGGIEGPACDKDGNLYAVNYGHKGTIGKVTSEGESSLFVELPEGSAGNGIRFHSDGSMLIADYVGHNILRVDMITHEISVYAHEPAMSQPNDLAISDNDIIYASDPNWSESSGRIWRIDTDGTTTVIASELGITNGIEINPENNILYANDTKKSNVWAFDLSVDGEISGKRLLINLGSQWLDGMRCDIDGNLYVTVNSKGKVVKVSPDGTISREIKLIGSGPSNIAFGGTDGRTCYVTMADNGNIETFRVEKPGRSWQMYQDGPVSRIAERENQPQIFNLTGNFPNPFNASTIIEYTLTKNALVELAVFNIAGQKITTLKKEYQHSGRYSVRWNAGNLPSGAYFYALTSGGITKSGRMVLVR
ncbi:MAG: SMP-30/gluconolactonase/LRE family protein [Candidatus Latescibacteria bacterium]|nr:SMP-30/gluconolactonase/LRE family protein [Candidatus Latescibacterota bacterium]